MSSLPILICFIRGRIVRSVLGLIAVRRPPSFVVEHAFVSSPASARCLPPAASNQNDAILQQVLAEHRVVGATHQAIVACSMRGIGVLETTTLPTMPAVQSTRSEQPITSSVAMFEWNRW
jgi:hypothetical protein